MKTSFFICQSLYAGVPLFWSEETPGLLEYGKLFFMLSQSSFQAVWDTVEYSTLKTSDHRDLNTVISLENSNTHTPLRSWVLEKKIAQNKGVPPACGPARPVMECLWLWDVFQPLQIVVYKGNVCHYAELSCTITRYLTDLTCCLYTRHVHTNRTPCKLGTI